MCNETQEYLWRSLNVSGEDASQRKLTRSHWAQIMTKTCADFISNLYGKGAEQECKAEFIE